MLIKKFVRRGIHYEADCFFLYPAKMDVSEPEVILIVREIFVNNKPNQYGAKIRIKSRKNEVIDNICSDGLEAGKKRAVEFLIEFIQKQIDPNSIIVE